MSFKIIIAVIAIMLSACTSDNEHFCARYEYVYKQLDDPELPSYDEMKQALQLEINQRPKDSDQQRFMLFVLEEYHLEIKPGHKSPQAFCMDTKRWQYYP